MTAKTGMYRYTIEVDEDDLQTFEIPYYYNVIGGDIYLVFDEMFRNSTNIYIANEQEVDTIRGKIKTLLKLGGAA